MVWVCVCVCGLGTQGLVGREGFVWYLWGWLGLLLDLAGLVEHVMGYILVVYVCVCRGCVLGGVGG